MKQELQDIKKTELDKLKDLKKTKLQHHREDNVE